MGEGGRIYSEKGEVDAASRSDDVRSGDLCEAWNSGEYTRFREKVRDFDYSPCHVCGGCTMLEKNEEDCYGNTFPVCGGCLWAQGIIQCP